VETGMMMMMMMMMMIIIIIIISPELYYCLEADFDQPAFKTRNRPTQTINEHGYKTK
jgi:hypothetical protein